MFISFVFIAKYLWHADEEYFKYRIKRLGFPYIVWGIIPLFVYIFFEYVFKVNIGVDYHDLPWQMFLGCSNINPPLYFLFDIIIFTILFYFLRKVLKNRFALFLCLLIYASIFFEYTGLNYKAFGGLRFEISNPIGRYTELLPYACIGVLVGRDDLLLRSMKRKWRFVVIISLVSIISFMMLPIFAAQPKGFEMGGMKMILISICIVALFAVIPFSKTNDITKKGILFLSRYSMGVFCIHWMVGKIFETLILPKLGFETRSLVEAILIYFISIIICMGIDHIPTKRISLLVT